MYKIIAVAVATLFFASCFSSWGFSDLIASGIADDQRKKNQQDEADRQATQPPADNPPPADARKPAPSPRPNDNPPAKPKRAEATQGTKINAKLEFAKYRDQQPSTKNYGNSAEMNPASFGQLKGGEWVMYRLLDGNKITSIMKMAILDKQGDMWVYEFVSINPDGASVIQMGVRGLEQAMRSGNQDKADIAWIKMKDEKGEITTIDGAMLQMFGGSYKNMLGATTVKTDAKITDGGPITVVAGTFASSWKIESKVSDAKGNASKGTAWVSSAVPFTHIIKSTGDNKRDGMELIDFGTAYVSMLN